MRKELGWSASAVAGSLLLAAGLFALAGAAELAKDLEPAVAEATDGAEPNLLPDDSPRPLAGEGAEPSRLPKDSPRPLAKEGQGVRAAASETAPKPPPPASPAALSPAMSGLRDRARRVAGLCYRQAFNTRDNTPSEILNFCLAFGCDAEVGHAGPSAAKVNGIGCLCWNLPCAGYTLLQMDEDRVMARLGYGLQEHPSQLLAVLAQTRVPANYEIRVGQNRRTVADLAESEKLSCLPGSDLSLKLLGLSHYVADDAAWKNRLGETWSVERLLEHELERSTSQADCEATNRLMGISYAVRRRIARKAPLEGPYARAQKHVSECQDYALKLQNPDGSWHPAFLALQGTSTDVAGTLRSTGHVLEWLAFSLPDERLEEAAVVKALGYLTALLENRQAAASLASLPPREIEGAMHAVHALMIYDQRVFSPREAEKPAETKKADAAPQSPAE